MGAFSFPLSAFGNPKSDFSFQFSVLRAAGDLLMADF